jgi:hypothetical protein
MGFLVSTGFLTWLLGFVSRPVIIRAAKELDGHVAVLARVAYGWHMLRGIRQHPQGYVLCPVCYGKGSYDGHPLCSFCHIPNQSSDLWGYMTCDLFKQRWDELRWKPQPDWPGYRLAALFPDVVVRGWSPRDQRRYRESLDAPYKTWRTPTRAT